MNKYDASDIEVLEGLEPVRLRPGMYIGGTDEKAWHHLPVEIMDNSIDEAVAGFAKKIVVNLIDSKTIEITDDGRGIPVDEHPKYPGKSALEVILTTLHSGGKFNNNVYKAYSNELFKNPNIFSFIGQDSGKKNKHEEEDDNSSYYEGEINFDGVVNFWNEIHQEDDDKVKKKNIYRR